MNYTVKLEWEEVELLVRKCIKEQIKYITDNEETPGELEALKLVYNIFSPKKDHYTLKTNENTSNT